MYQAHWGLQRTPFPGWIDSDAFYEGPGFCEALARLRFLVDNRRRLGLLTGQRGSGKSTVFEMLARRLRAQGCQVAVTSMLGLDQVVFLTSLAESLQLDVATGESLVSIWRSIGDRLVTNRYQRIQTVFLLDDADDAEPDALTSVVRLAQLDQSTDPCLSIVLASTAEHAELLGQRLQDMCELRVDLEPLDLEQTREFIDFALAKAGREAPAFQQEAIERIHDCSQGAPRRIGQLAELCLIAGAGQGLNQVEAETVDAAFEELSVTPQRLGV